MTESQIQDKIYYEWMGNGNILIPNITYVLGEMDMLVMRKTGYIEELEIKSTIADFKADFNKRKHIRLNHWYHTATTQRLNIPNKFSYVVDRTWGLTAKDVPEYAGLYEYSHEEVYKPRGDSQVLNRRATYGLVTVKRAQFIHKSTFTEFWTPKIIQSLNWKVYNLRQASTSLYGRYKLLMKEYDRVREWLTSEGIQIPTDILS